MKLDFRKINPLFSSINRIHPLLNHPHPYNIYSSLPTKNKGENSNWKKKKKNLTTTLNSFILFPIIHFHLISIHPSIPPFQPPKKKKKKKRVENQSQNPLNFTVTISFRICCFFYTNERTNERTNLCFFVLRLNRSKVRVCLLPQSSEALDAVWRRTERGACFCLCFFFLVCGRRKKGKRKGKGEGKKRIRW